MSSLIHLGLLSKVLAKQFLSSLTTLPPSDNKMRLKQTLAQDGSWLNRKFSVSFSSYNTSLAKSLLILRPVFFGFLNLSTLPFKRSGWLAGTCSEYAKHDILEQPR
jgi:hypothetical protein